MTIFSEYYGKEHMNIILFDIDGTLIHSGGSGVHGMNLAFEEICGIKEAFKDIPLSGRTDIVILNDALERRGLTWSEPEIEHFKARYFIHLVEDMQRPRQRRRIMPGFPQLLEALSTRSDCRLGLLTGNWHKSAEIKLAHFDLWKYFAFGAFADDESDRNRLLPHAVRRAEEQYGLEVNHENVYVIGDTPRDVQCARPHGAVAVAVATGEFTLEQLRLAEPDFLFADFSSFHELLALFSASR